MTASYLFCVPVNDKAIQNIVFNKCSVYFWSEDLVKKSKETSFSPENFLAIIAGLIVFHPLDFANKVCGCCWTTPRKVNTVNAELLVCGEKLSMGKEEYMYQKYGKCYYQYKNGINTISKQRKIQR